MQLDPPHQLISAIAHSYGFFLWKVSDHDEVWKRIPAKAPSEKHGEMPSHWVKVGRISDVQRHDAKTELYAAWDEYSKWKEAYTCQK